MPTRSGSASIVDRHGDLIADWLERSVALRPRPRARIASMTQVLILDMNAEQYRERLAQRFPAVAVPRRAPRRGGRARHRRRRRHHRARPSHPERADRQPRKRLKWVQALTTGTDTLTAPGVLPPHVLLTSTRGIHGPQMSELAFLNMIALARDFRRMQRNQAEAQVGAMGPADPARARPSSSSAWASWPSISPSAASCSACTSSA